MLYLLSKKILLKQISSESEKEAKKLVLVLVTSTPVTGTRKEVAEAAGAGKNGKESKGEYLENLTQVPCIRYPITFWKNSVLMLALFDSGSKVNTIYLTFAQELRLPIRPTNIGV